MARRQKLVVVRVNSGDQTFRLPVKVPASEAEDARNLLVLLMKQMGLMPATAARQPGLTQPKSTYMVPGLDVVNVKQEWRGVMACALKVGNVSLCCSHLADECALQGWMKRGVLGTFAQACPALKQLPRLDGSDAVYVHWLCV